MNTILSPRTPNFLIIRVNQYNFIAKNAKRAKNAKGGPMG